MIPTGQRGRNGGCRTGNFPLAIITVSLQSFFSPCLASHNPQSPQSFQHRKSSGHGKEEWEQAGRVSGFGISETGNGATRVWLDGSLDGLQGDMGEEEGGREDPVRSDPVPTSMTNLATHNMALQNAMVF